MSHAQQPSIRSFFQPRPQPNYAAPPSAATTTPPSDIDNDATTATSPPPPPRSPPPAAEPNQLPPPPPAAADVLPVALPPGGVPILPSPPSLPSQASIIPVTEDHIAALRRINSLLLPVAYPDSFYAKALEPLASGLFSRSILWQDSANVEPKVIGGVVCRLEPNPFLDASGRPRPPETSATAGPPLETPYHAIYIQSLVLLSPYRAQGLAAAALEHIVASAAILPAAGSSIDVRTVYAHVWTENEEGVRWYEARGFTREGREPVRGYYFRLRPDTAWIVRREIGAGAAAARLPALAPAPRSQGGRINSAVAAAVNLPFSTEGPPRRPSAAPSQSGSSLSFQNARPQAEWNDLPADMVGPPLAGAAPPPSTESGRSQHLSPSSAPGSAASSRSSSAVRKKKERAYPSAAFGS
ncbi:hypothetical protein B0T25DRAFT_526891 [Lasiosphaeria hispida]|uniref:N-acetyltransferase domain-containing protein n=1 Tax=Lasiosphaeria hispida TaxID=260671 RepID=A0AAJ0HV67_9PEZI|nr:hypothetical protein B0T25DRAFT_526891 [Lasiosphaeria hispida]